MYIFHQIYKVQLGNSKAVAEIKNKNPLNIKVRADSEEPRSIAAFRTMGLNIIGARKGPDSVEYGIKYLSEEIEEIIIDPVRCPDVKREFLGYEIEKDKEGNLKGEYPDKNNHTIDAVRYAIEEDILMHKNDKYKEEIYQKGKGVVKNTNADPYGRKSNVF